MRAFMIGLGLLLGPGPGLAGEAAQLGPRPFYPVDQLKPGPLKDTLAACGIDRTYTPRAFSIWAVPTSEFLSKRLTTSFNFSAG